MDAAGQQVTIRSAACRGWVVAGLAGYGKASILHRRSCQLAVNPAAQFVRIDGEGGPDYDDLFARVAVAKADPQTVRDRLVQAHALAVGRQHEVRAVLGVTNMWRHGPRPVGLQTVVVLGEAHPSSTKPRHGSRVETLDEPARIVEELIC